MERIIQVSVVILAFVFVFQGCRPQDEHECETYCDEMVACADLLNQPESRSRCERECFEALDGYENAGCGNRYLDLIECQTDISCTGKYDVGDKCSNEIDVLAKCLE